MVDWSELPYDLIGKVAEKLDQVEDLIAFSCVCSSWKANATQHNWSPDRQLPWLVLSDDLDNKSNNKKRGFYNLYKKKRFDLELPEARGRRCWGSTNGWICTVGTDKEINLLNPLTRNKISLPPMTAFDPPPPQDYWYGDTSFVFRMIPFKEDGGFVVAAIFGQYPNKLSFARPGDEAWTTIADLVKPGYTYGVSPDTDTDEHNVFVDVVLINGRLLAADKFGAIYHCDLESSPKAGLVLVASAPRELEEYEIMICYVQLHLVNCFGQLLLIAREREYDENEDLKTIWVSVYKLDFKTNEWVDVEVLGDYDVFVGSNCSIAVPKSEIVGCNNIYFSDDEDGRWTWNSESPGGRDMGVFNMEDKTFTSHYTGDNVLTTLTAPFWITPSF